MTLGNQECEVLLISGCVARTAINEIDKTKRIDRSLAQFSVGRIALQDNCCIFGIGVDFKEGYQVTSGQQNILQSACTSSIETLIFDTPLSPKSKVMPPNGPSI